jgi:hypothetical protein
MWVRLARGVCADPHTHTEPCRRFRKISIRLVAATHLLAAVYVCAIASADGPRNPLCTCVDCRCSTALTQQHCAAESQNFVVRSFLGGPAASDVAEKCESVCGQLRRDVFGLGAAAHWQPKCRVVLHATRQDYLRAVGPGASQTVGTSAISISGGRVTQRRIALLAVDAAQGLSAMPHEMVHVLFVDAFPNDPPPKWAEEGVALLMDPADKRARHAHDLEAALRAHSTLPLRRFLDDVEYPATPERAAFYGQSMSLVDYFMRLSSPKDFIRYLHLSATRGQETALRTVYQFDSSELERRWWQHATGIQLAAAEAR